MKGIKYDGGKVRPSLILDDMRNALNAVMQVAEFGAEKYSAGGWQFVDNGKERYRDAKFRHALNPAGRRDDESGLLHLAHEAWNALALLELQIRDENALAEQSKFENGSD